MTSNEISIPRPDDWHVHLRDGQILASVIEHTAKIFGRAIVMPNLDPAVATASAAAAYRSRITALIPPHMTFTPLMTCYLTDEIDSSDLRAGYRDEIFIAAKLYPAGATTNAHAGVTNLDALDGTLNVMQEIGMPLLVHGEVVDQSVDIFDRESVFIDSVLAPLVRRYPELPVVLEHVTTREGVEFVTAQGPHVAATITPHHLTINRNAIFRGGIRPHYYCLPVAKRRSHQLALREAAVSRNPKFFLGTDSAPHLTIDKESACGCAGVFNAQTAMSCYAQVFDEHECLERLAGFSSHFGADFYGLPRNTEQLTLRKGPALNTPPDVEIDAHRIRHFLPDEPVHWHISDPSG
jgi:dihydroorotase